MSTNYYLRKPPCRCCTHQEEGIHIGKSSMGWRFIFNGSLGVSIHGWRNLIASNEVCIYDEYGECVSKAKFWDMVEEKKEGKAFVCDTNYLDDEGNIFCTVEFC